MAGENNPFSDPQSTWVHFVAVGGKGMGALAVLLAQKGFQVTGSDGPLFPPMSDYLSKNNISYKSEYSESNLNGESWGITKDNPDVVIVGNAISRGHVEAELARELLEKGKAVRMSFAEALRDFAIRGNESFVITGTHGKSTSSSLMAWALERCGHKAGFFIGAIPANFGQPCRLAESKEFVSEGDEYDTAYWEKVSKFLHYLPDWVMCTGIEFDHADIFANLESIEESFLELVERSNKGWVLIDNESAPQRKSVERVQSQLIKSGKACFRYGFSEKSDYRIEEWESLPLSEREGLIGTRFALSFRGKAIGRFRSSMIGRHNVLNAAGALATLHASGVVTEFPEDVFVDYEGISKRQEELFSNEATVLIDDFAHHPRAIAETVAALRLRYPGRYLRAFFEPRSATSARNLLLEDFKNAFVDADEVFLLQATKSNVPEDERLDVRELQSSLRQQGRQVQLASDFDELQKLIGQRAPKEKELLVFMSNGSFGGIPQRLRSQLS